jgi:hypothetical protein
MEVNNDYKLSKTELATARAQSDEGSIAFYELACQNLKEELKSFASAFILSSLRSRIQKIICIYFLSC